MVFSIIGGQPAEPPPTFQSEDELLAWLQTGQPKLCVLAVIMFVSVDDAHLEAQLRQKSHERHIDLPRASCVVVV